MRYFFTYEAVIRYAFCKSLQMIERQIYYSFIYSIVFVYKHHLDFYLYFILFRTWPI